MLVGSVKVQNELEAYKGIKRLELGMKPNNGRSNHDTANIALFTTLEVKKFGGKIYHSKGHHQKRPQGQTQPALHRSTAKAQMEHQRDPRNAIKTKAEH